MTLVHRSRYSERGFLRFDLCHPSLVASEQSGGRSVCKTHYGSERLSGYRTAASAAVMRTGVHFAEFTIEAQYALRSTTLCVSSRIL